MRASDIDFRRDWAAWATARHTVWHTRVAAWCRAHRFDLAATTPLPNVEIPLEVTRKIAWATPATNTCHYPLPFVMYFGDEFDEAIGHEMCHCFQYRVMRECDKHGEIWQMLMRQACGLQPQRCRHVPEMSVVRQIGSVLMTTVDMAAMGVER